MRSPIYHGILQDPLDCDDHPIIGIPSESLQQVWITNVARTDGLTGTGTRTNPFDGSTQPLLDAVFQSYYDAGTTDIVFHLSPGTFSMIGAWDGAWGLLDGWHIKGAGKTLTRVVQVGGNAGVDAGSNGALFGEGTAQVYDNQSVEDLWCDCAWFRSGPGGNNLRPHGEYKGVSLYGSNCTIRNVRVTGFGWADARTYGAKITGGITNLHLPDNALIENCEFYEEGGLNSTAMAMVNKAALDADVSPIYAANGRMIGNLVGCPTASTCPIPEGFDGGCFRDNKVIVFNAAITHYEARSQNIQITGNDLTARSDSGVGVLFQIGTGTSEKLQFVDNTIRSAGGIALLANVTDSRIARNRISLYPGSNNNNSINLAGATVTNIAVLDNIIDSGIPYTNSGTTGCWFKNNRTPDGEIQIQDSSDAVPTTLFVSQFYGDATTAARLRPAQPFLTINAAIAAASSGDTVEVLDGTFNETLTAKNGVTVRFHPQARLLCSTAGACIVSTGTSQTFTVYHEHTNMVCAVAATSGIVASHAGANFKIYGGISVVGSGASHGIAASAGTVEIWGDVTSASGFGVDGFSGTPTIIVHGDITGSTDYAVVMAGGTVRVYDGKITGSGAASAVRIDASAARHIYKNCTIISGISTNPAVSFSAVGSILPIFRNCVLVSGSSATESILSGSAQSILLYGTTVANKGPSPPTNVTVVIGTYAVSSSVISDV